MAKAPKNEDQKRDEVLKKMLAMKPDPKKPNEKKAKAKRKRAAT